MRRPGPRRAFFALPFLQAVVAKWETMRRRDTPDEKKSELAAEVLEAVSVERGGGVHRSCY